MGVSVGGGTLRKAGGEMNAKQLTDAAKRVLKNIPTADTRLLADHILATVRPDDDESVTREGLEIDEDWRWDESSGLFKNTRRGHIEISIYKDVASLWCGDEDDQNGVSVDLKSMGHLRRLVAALGE